MWRCATIGRVTAVYASHLQAPVFPACLENNSGTACSQRDRRAPCGWPRPCQPMKPAAGRGRAGTSPRAVQSRRSDSTRSACPSVGTCIPACTRPLGGGGSERKRIGKPVQTARRREKLRLVFTASFWSFYDYFHGLTRLLLS